MTAEAMPAPTVVIGVGNPMRRDDGVGSAVVAALAGTPVGAAELLVLDGESTRLVEAWRGRRRVIVVDAARSGAPPGTVTRVDVGRADLPVPATAPSSHAAGVAEAVALARALDALPSSLVVYAVEAGDLGQGEGLSEGVGRAVATLAERIRTELGVPAGGSP